MKNRWNKFQMIAGKRWKFFTNSISKLSAEQTARMVRSERGFNARILISKSGKKHPWSKSPSLYRYAVYFRQGEKRKRKIYTMHKGWH